MKLVNAEYGISLEIADSTNILVIENPRILYSVCNEIRNQCNGEDGRFILSENNKDLKIRNCCECIDSAFSIDFSSRRIVNKLYSDFLSSANEFPEEWNSICNMLISFVDKLIEKENYSSIEFNDVIDLVSLLKIMDVRISKEYNRFEDKLIEYIKVLGMLLNVKICFLIGVCSFIDSSLISEIIHMSNYYHVNLVFIESELPDYEFKKMNTNVNILDKDLCLIAY